MKLGGRIALALFFAPAAAFAQVSPAPYTSATRYDGDGRVTGTISADPAGLDARPFLAVRTSYDGAGRPIRVENGSLAAWQSEAVAPAAWTGFTIYRTAEMQYDGAGHKLRESLREGGAGTVRQLAQYSYDSVGRLECSAVRMNPAVFGSLPASACALGTEGSDGADRVARSVYDAAGQRLQQRVGAGTADEGAAATWAYDLDGQVTTMIDGNGNRAELHYDGFERQDRWTFPSGTRPSGFNDATPANALATAGGANAADYEAYGYDANGNRTSLRKRDGSTLSYAYDALNRVTVKTVPERTSGSQTLTTAQTRDVYLGYDNRNLQLFARFDSASGEGVANTYDGFGRLVSSGTDMGGTTRTLSYQYDRDGARTRITHPDGLYFDTSYDRLGRPIYMGANGTTTIAVVYYHSFGGVNAVGHAGTSVYGYDDIQQPLWMLDYFTGATGNALWNYTRNPAGQLSGITRDNDAFAWTAHYAVNRGYTTNGLNQYTAAGSATFTYDANGNLISDGATGYVYDIENRLVAATGGHSATLTYDPLGRLWQVTNNTTGAVTRFLYDGDALVGEYDGSGAMLRRHVHNVGADVPMVSYEGATLATPRHLFADHQGSIVAAVDATGAPVTINSYDEYGIPGAANAGRFQYTGQAWLSELGMYYYKARIYSPTLGRFLQVDPIGYADQFNLYAYVGSDPLNRVDPSGNDALVIINWQTGTVDIRLPIHFTGDAAADPANVANITNSMQSLSQDILPAHVTVTVVPLTTQDIANGAPITNEVELTNGPVVGGINNGNSDVNPHVGNEAHITMMDVHGQAVTGNNTWRYGAKDDATGAHYAGHLMGLHDTHRAGDNVMDAGPGRVMTKSDLAQVLQRDPPDSGVRNRIVKCPSPEPECPH